VGLNITLVQGISFALSICCDAFVEVYESKELEIKMLFLRFFIIFAVFYAIFDWIIRKTDFHNKLFGNPQKSKFTRTILILILLFLTFSIQYGAGILNDKYGQHNYMSTIIGAFLGSIYVNFAPLIFRKSKP